MLAHLLPKVEYGVFALTIAVLFVTAGLAPLGADGVVIRRQVSPSSRLLRRVLLSSAIVSTLSVSIGEWLYRLPGLLLFLVLAGAIASGACSLAAAHLQSQLRFDAALAVSLSGNFVLLVGAIVAWLLQVREAWLPIAVLALGYGVTALVSWSHLLDGTRRRVRKSRRFFPWSEAFSYGGVAAGGILLVQLDRLVIPRLLTLEELATFGVLAAVVGSPFRMLQLGAGYTLQPRLRAAESPKQRRGLFRREAITVALVALAAAVALWYLAPFVVHLLLQGKYHLSPALVAAALTAGVVKVASSFVGSLVTALGSVRRLFLLNVFGWIAVLLAVVGAAIGARWGLAGVICGVAAGWAGRTLVAWLLGAHYLSRRLPRDRSQLAAQLEPGDEPQGFETDDSRSPAAAVTSAGS